MLVMSLTEFKKWIKEAKAEEIRDKEPVEVMFNGESIRKFVPKSWRDPRFPLH